MTAAKELAQQAKAIPREERAGILTKMKETDVHEHLAALFRAMEPDYWVEVTHGADEYGKDLVIVRKDSLSSDVIAVLVKVGDIKAKTAGQVDQMKQRAEGVLSAKGERVVQELLSQIGQARTHSAELRAYLRRLQVTKVIVVLIGEFSGNARERLEKELGTTGTIFDLGWAVDTFTEKYPQVFFEGRATTFLETLIRDLENDTFYAKTGKTLSECFVYPLVARNTAPVSVNQKSLAIRSARVKVQFANLTQMVHTRNRLVLVGDPGSGKSKALAKVCIDSYRDVFQELLHGADKTQQLGIPILTTARKLEEAKDLTAFLDAHLPPELRDRFRIDMLLIDALDEVSGGKREEVLSKAEEFANALDCGLLITSRKIALLEHPPKGFERYELLQFEFGQAMKLIEKLITSSTSLPALRDGLKRVRAQLPMNPLSLLLIVQLVTERKEIPSSITELYDRFLDLVLGRWDHEKGIEVLFEYVVKKRFLGALAYREFHEKDRLEAPRAEYEAFVKTYALEYGWDAEKLSSFLKELERAGVLEIQDEVFFRHRSFLDYFVAYYVYERRTEFSLLNVTLARLYFDDLWSDVPFFFVGLSREVGQDLLESILNVQDPRLAAGKVLIGRLLQAGWHSPTKIKDFGVRQALGYVLPARRNLQEALTNHGLDTPALIIDVYAMLLADASFGSMFLSSEIRSLLAELTSDAVDEEGILKRLALISAGKRVLGREEVLDHVSTLVAATEKAKLPPHLEARLLVLAATAASNDHPVVKTITKRLKRLAAKSPELLKGILPEPKKGFRSS